MICPIMFWAQKVEIINLNKSVDDPRSSFKSFNVIDERPEKQIGGVMYHNELVTIGFENDAVTDIKKWFYKKNELKGKDDLILLLENIKVSEEAGEKYSEGKLNFKASTFLKKPDGYHFIYRKDTVFTVSSKTTPYMARNLSARINEGLTELLRSSYKFVEWNQAISENELKNYENVIKNNFELFKGNDFKEGVYKDFYSFFSQKPEEGFTLEINEKGNVTRAVNGKERIPLRSIYVYVLNGKAYKNTPIGFTEISKDERGFYILSNRGSLFPEQMNAAYGAFGLVGATIGALDTISKNKREKKKEKLEVYLDPFTGNYIFDEE